MLPRGTIHADSRWIADRLCRKIVGSDPLPDDAWVRITEAIGHRNWSLSLSPQFRDDHRTRCQAECDLLEATSPQVDWSEVTNRRGLIRELTRYLD